MAEVDELNRQIQIREMRREKLEVDLDSQIKRLILYVFIFGPSLFAVNR